MIQRIQSIWLLLAALFSSLAFVLDVLTVRWYALNGTEMERGIQLLEHSNYMLIAIVIFTVLLPTLAIFFYKNRKQQKWVAIFSILLNIAFIALYIASKDKAVVQKPPVQNTAFAFGGFMPVFSIIFLIMAIRGINKDEKLVKSLDRLR